MCAVGEEMWRERSSELRTRVVGGIVRRVAAPRDCLGLLKITEKEKDRSVEAEMVMALAEEQVRSVRRRCGILLRWTRSDVSVSVVE